MQHGSQQPNARRIERFLCLARCQSARAIGLDDENGSVGDRAQQLGISANACSRGIDQHVLKLVAEFCKTLLELNWRQEYSAIVGQNFRSGQPEIACRFSHTARAEERMGRRRVRPFDSEHTRRGAVSAHWRRPDKLAANCLQREFVQPWRRQNCCRSHRPRRRERPAAEHFRWPTRICAGRDATSPRSPAFPASTGEDRGQHPIGASAISSQLDVGLSVAPASISS